MSTSLDETRNGDWTAEATSGVNTREYTERLELLYEVLEKASSLEEVSSLLEEILSVIQRILRASAASLFLVDQEKQELYVPAAGGEVANALRQVRVDFSSGVVGWVANNGSPVLLGDVTSDDRFNSGIDKATGFLTRSILAVPLVRGRKVIGVLELLNKTDGSPFNEQDLEVLTGLVSTEGLILLVSMAATAITNIKLSQQTLDGCRTTVETLVTAADARDPYAWGHSQRVKKYTMAATSALSLPAEELQAIEFGALLHDIGKIGISESILRKSDKLTSEEWYMIRKHPLRGANIVGQIPYLERAREIVLYHHERYDGAGYPEGLRGEGIPLGARLVAVADAFDTMTTDHSYRHALSVDEAIRELIKGKGTQFCPAAIEAFIAGSGKNILILDLEKGTDAKEEKAGNAALPGPTEGNAAAETTETAPDTDSVDPSGSIAVDETTQIGPDVAPAELTERTSGEETGEAAMDAAGAEPAGSEEASATTEIEKLARDIAAAEAQRSHHDGDSQAQTVLEVTPLQGPPPAWVTPEPQPSTQEKPAEETHEVEPVRPEAIVSQTGVTYQGEVQLVVPPPAHFDQVRELQDRLEQVENLRVVMVGGTADEGALILVSLREPLDLEGILAAMPEVETVAPVVKKGARKLAVQLRPPANDPA